MASAQEHYTEGEQWLEVASSMDSTPPERLFAGVMAGAHFAAATAAAALEEM